ncbi:MAG: outer membrane beta-barrel protein, partial [Limisphaerales bacterium]
GDIVNFYNTDRVVGGVETVSPGNTAEEFTLDIQYSLWANVMTRGEFRWDHVEHGDPFGASPNTGLPYKSGDFLLALNVIYQF